MQVRQVLLLLMSLHTIGQAAPSRPAVRAAAVSDRDALLAFKEGLLDHLSSLSSWNETNADFCQWAGVTCSRRHPGRVSALDLPASGLVGGISSSVGNLTFLQRLNLSSNGLEGEIPSSISRLRGLRVLDLGNNSLHGAIPPDLCNCSYLAFLYLDDNELTGEIPFALGALSKLEALSLTTNNLTGLIPASFANFSLLQQLSLRKNNLGGTIPEGLARLGFLNHFDLGINNFSGTIPPSFFNKSTLKFFNVATNKMHGRLPAEANVLNLQVFKVGNNHFSGTIPAWLANATMIQLLSIARNNIGGKVSPELGKLCPIRWELGGNQLEAVDARDWEFLTFLTNCSRLQLLDMPVNKLAGVLPSSVANLSTQLQWLSFSENNITGAIPAGIGNLFGLTALQLGQNDLTGTIPTELGKLQRLQELELEINHPSGSVPPSLGNITQLLRFLMSYNSLDGFIPASLGNLKLLATLQLSHNKLVGSVPKEIFSLSSLSDSLLLSSNNLSGPLRPEIGRLRNVARLDLSSNNLSGEIPGSLRDCQSLEYLNLGSNFFAGKIPPSLSNLKGLMRLDLTRNKLSGSIPPELGNIYGLQELYLSHNNLTGDIPKQLGNLNSLVALDLFFNHLEGPVPSHGVFLNMSGFSIVGNDGLCDGILELQLPLCSVKSKGKNSQFPLNIVIPIASIALCLILLLLFLYLLNWRRKLRKMTTDSRFLLDDKYPRVSYAQLSEATDGFASANLIGAGKYGSVYKGNMSFRSASNDQNTMVAIKVFNLQQWGCSGSFIAECEALRRTRHRNLLKIITSCSTIDSDGEDFKALVFEFMPNFSLDRWLIPRTEGTEQTRRLSLMQRLKIAVDVGDALDYLHNACEPPIVHCDLKPTNILLAEDLTARLADFGISKIVVDPMYKQLGSESSIGIRGTIGYVPPEYGAGSQVSTSGDVYSYGILLLEIFTGKTPTDEMLMNGLTLHSFVQMASPERIMEIVDPALLSRGKSGSWDMEQDCLVSVIRVGLLCSKHAPAERMSTKGAVVEMHKIKDIYLEEISSSTYV